jgi:hypothetical protein
MDFHSAALINNVIAAYMTLELSIKAIGIRSGSNTEILQSPHHSDTRAGIRTIKSLARLLVGILQVPTIWSPSGL